MRVSAAHSALKNERSSGGNSLTTCASPTANTGTDPYAKRVTPTPSESSRRMASTVAVPLPPSLLAALICPMFVFRTIGHKQNWLPFLAWQTREPEEGP